MQGIVKVSVNHRQKLESGHVIGEITPQATSKAPTREQPNPVARLLRGQVREFLALLPVLMSDGDPETVHDMRVATRRIQQGLATLFPKPQPNKVQRLRRTMRRVRRLLGEWRNCDVVVEIVAQEQRRTRSPIKRGAWETVRRCLVDRRSEQALRARRKLFKRDLGDAFGSLYALLDDAVGQESIDASLARLRPGIASAWTQFESTLAKARESYDPTHLHSLRVATKRLRYRLELAHNLGDDRMKPIVGWSKKLQEVLGKWHDRQVLRQMVAQALARPDFMLRDPVMVRALLTELEKDRVRQRKTADEILSVAVEHPVHDDLVSAAKATG